MMGQIDLQDRDFPKTLTVTPVAGFRLFGIIALLILIPNLGYSYGTVFNPFTGKLDFVTILTTTTVTPNVGLPLPTGDTNYVQVSTWATVQSGAFDISSGTISTSESLSYLKSDAILGTNSTGKIVADPGGSANYIQNQPGIQGSANLGISGFGTFDGGVQADNYYNLGGNFLVNQDVGETNTFIASGFGILPGSLSGTNNICVGNTVCHVLTTGNQNTCFGYSTCDLLTKGTVNSVFGTTAGAALTTGSNNTFFGNVAGRNSTTGNYNTLVGNGAGDDFTTSVENTCVGDTSCNNIITGSSNTAIGYGTTQNAGGTTATTYIGAQAGAANTTDVLNKSIAIGYGAIVSSSFTAQFGGTQGSGNEVKLIVSTLTVNNHYSETSSVQPVISSCGTSPSVVGGDSAGTISVGSGVAVTGCTLTFAVPWVNTPMCTESDNSTAITGDIASISNTAVTFGFSASLGGGKIYYICIGSD
jgi:hypothetical protein